MEINRKGNYIFINDKWIKINVYNGYEHVRINGKRITVHRLVYETFHQVCILPGNHIHHKDENKKNNNIDNLELLSESEHKRLHFMGNQIAFKGGSVRWHKRIKKWIVSVCSNYKSTHLGYYNSKEEGQQILNNYYSVDEK